MDDNKFWLGFWTLCAVVVIAVAAIIALCSMDTNTKIAEAIKEGANPLDAPCAYEGSTTYCLVRAGRKE